MISYSNHRNVIIYILIINNTTNDFNNIFSMQQSHVMTFTSAQSLRLIFEVHNFHNTMDNTCVVLEIIIIQYCTICLICILRPLKQLIPKDFMWIFIFWRTLHEKNPTHYKKTYLFDLCIILEMRNLYHNFRYISIISWCNLKSIETNNLML